MNDSDENPMTDRPVSIDQNGVMPGPRKMLQFRDACRLAKLPDEARHEEKDDPEKGRPIMARLKLFNPSGVGTWLLQDWCSTENYAFGWCCLGDDRLAELGYVSLRELANYKGPFGVGIEIDNGFTPKPMDKAIAENLHDKNDSEEKQGDAMEIIHNEHFKRFTTEVAPLLQPHVGKPVHQRVQLWIKARTGGVNLTSFLNNGVDDDEKRKLMDDLVTILKGADWGKLPAAPSGQADVPAEKPSTRELITRVNVPEPKVVEAVEPKADDDEEEDMGPDYEPEPKAELPEVAAPAIAADDPVAMIMAGLKKMTQRPAAKEGKHLSEADVRRIVREEIRSVFAAIK